MSGSAGAIKAGRAFVELFADDKKLNKGLHKAGKKLRSWGSSLTKTGLKITAAGGAVVAPFIASLKQFASTGDELTKMSQRTGIAVDVLSELKYAAEQSGTNMETFEGSIRKMQKFLVGAAQGSGEAQTALARLGLTAGQLSGMAPDQQFEVLADRISNISDPSLKAATAMEIFGKSGTELLPLMEDGAGGIEKLREEARRLGLTFNKETAGQATELGDRFDDLKKVFKSTTFAIGGALAPAVTDLLKDMIGLALGVSTWIKENKELFVTIAKVAGIVFLAGSALVSLGISLSLAGMAVGGIVSAVLAFKAVVAAAFAFIISPIGIAVAAIGSLASVILLGTETGRDALFNLGDGFRTLLGDAKEALGGVIDALMSGDFALAGRILWLTLKMEWERGVNFLNKIWQEWKSFFLHIWTTATFALSQAFFDAWYGVQSVFNTVVWNITDTWARLNEVFASTWYDTVGFIKEAWVRLKALFSKDVDVGIEVKRIREETRAKRSAAEQERKERTQKLTADKNARESEIRDNRKAVADELKEMSDREHRLIDEKADASVKQSEADLQAAKDAARAAREEAAGKRKAFEGRDFSKKKAADDRDIIPISDKTSVTGTFNPAVADRLGSLSQNPLQQAVKLLGDIKKNTDSLKDPREPRAKL